jgi:hypothetical protein
MGLRDKLIAEALGKEEYLESIGKRKVKQTAYKAQEWRVPDDDSRDVLEAVVLQECKDLLKKMPDVWFERIEAPVKIVGKGQVIPSAARGLPDLLICRSGVLYAAELKRSKGGHLSGEQLSKLLAMSRAGARVGIVQSASGLARLLEQRFPRIVLKTTYGEIKVY